MVKIDVGLTPTADDKKAQKKARRSEKKGFKSDRYDAYQKKFHPTQWKKAQQEKSKKGQREGQRPKEIKFDDSSRREFLTTLHKKKNERRVTAFVDAKRKLAKENTKFRAEQKENARKMYNSMASIPILPNYSYKLPTLEDTLREARELAAEAEEDEEDEDAVSEEDLPEEDREQIVTEDGELDEEAYDRQERKRLARLAKRIEEKRNQTVFFSNSNNAAEEASGKKGGKKGAAASSSSLMEDSGVVVSVEPLFGRRDSVRAAPLDDVDANGRKLNKKQMSMQGSQRLVDSIAEHNSLPMDVLKELAKIREETKGPARTEPKLRMMKELEKIRKIQKHSRKGHGKKSKSGKKKNR